MVLVPILPPLVDFGAILDFRDFQKVDFGLPFSPQVSMLSCPAFGPSDRQRDPGFPLTKVITVPVGSTDSQNVIFGMGIYLFSNCSVRPCAI